MNRKKKKVFVAMSGGVDSSVAAALLKRAGFNVVGIYMKCWVEGLACTTQEDERSARLAAQHLGISFYVWNFIDQYKEKVVEYMLKGYEAGVTPNPDIMCNREIKFGLFFKKTMELGADHVATGHYVRVKKKNTGYALLKGKDSDKDQSYFLAMISPKVLEKTLFPIGEYTKTQVRAFARKIGLPNAERKDSQGICFVGKVEIGDFLRLHIPQKAGVIVSSSGEVLGEHDGAHYYTLGQRQGLGLAGGPYYVAKKDIETNTLQVTREEQDIMTSELLVKNVNWFLPLKEKTGISAKFRYRQEDVFVTIEELKDGSIRVIPEVPQRAITPGQFAVFYHGEELLGGGVIFTEVI
ncbi:tRNA 2-thiouridine(34) synthase MnmA [Patescibacteria group bacterium]|nr:tRNA 2-thiouridine(34) synthase MnmA [Patescibacteria group bacterium]